MVWSLHPMRGSRTTFISEKNINIINGAPHHHCGGGNGLFWGLFAGSALTSMMTSLFARPSMPTYNMGMFGGMYNPMMYGGFGGGTYPAIGTAGTQPQDNSMANLEKIAKSMKYEVVFNKNDNTYTAYIPGEDGGEIATGTYEEVRDAMLGTAKPSDRAASDASEITEIKRQAEMQGQLKEVKEEAEKFMKNTEVIASGAKLEVIEEDGDNFAQYKLTFKDGSSVVVKDITTAYEKLGIQLPGDDDAVHNDADDGQNTPVTPQNHDGNSGKIKLPEGWERDSFGYENGSPVGNYKNASEVLQQHLKAVSGEYVYASPMDPAKLEAEIVKHNPSVFNSDGTVKENADWSKLDLPNKQWLIENSYLTGKNAPADTTQLSQDAIEWNTAHPDKQATINSDGKYETKVYTKMGYVTVTANSFEELKKAAEEKIKRINGRTFNNGMGSYAEIGSYMQIKP